MFLCCLCLRLAFESWFVKCLTFQCKYAQAPKTPPSSSFSAAMLPQNPRCPYQASMVGIIMTAVVVFRSGYRSGSRSGWKKRRKCISKWLAATLECASLDMYYYIAVSLLRGAPWGVKVTKSIIPIYAMAPSALTMLASSLASSSKASWNRR